MDRSVSRRLFWTVSVISFGLIGLLAFFVINVMLGDEATRPARDVEVVQLGRYAPPTGDAARTTLANPEGLSQLFKEAADRVRDAVVYVQVEVDAREDDGVWEHRFFRRSPRQSVGSGVIISDDGYIVTNNHVVEGAARIVITLVDKRQYEAVIVGVDPSTDLAVLKIEEPASLPVVTLGDSDAVEVGQWVLAVGNPFRLTSTVTAGIVSALGRQVNIIGDSFRIEDFIQTDAAINPGNSGGALVDLNGALVGINTAIATETGSYEGYGFAVPVNLVARVTADLIKHGEVQRGYLGVKIVPVSARMAQRLGLDYIGGAYLQEVWQGGAADQAGLRTGDIVLGVGGKTIEAPNELQSMIARQRPGDEISLEVWRRGAKRHYDVVLMGRDDPVTQTWLADLSPPAELPEEDSGVPSDPEIDVVHLDNIGIGVRSADPRTLERFAAEAGVYVAYVEKGSNAERAGIRRDMLVSAVGSIAVTTVDELRKAFDEVGSQTERILVEVVRRDGIVVFYEVDMP